MANNEIFDLNTRKGRRLHKKAAQQAAAILNNGGAAKASEVYGKPTLHETAEEIVDAVQPVVVPVKRALRGVLDAVDRFNPTGASDIEEGYTAGIHPDTDVTHTPSSEKLQGLRLPASLDGFTVKDTVPVFDEETGGVRLAVRTSTIHEGDQVTAGVGAEEPTEPDYVDFDALDAEPTPGNYYVLSNGIEAKDVAAELSYNVGTAFTYMFRSSRVDGVIKGDPEADLNKAIDHLMFELERRHFTRKGVTVA